MRTFIIYSNWFSKKKCYFKLLQCFTLTPSKSPILTSISTDSLNLFLSIIICSSCNFHLHFALSSTFPNAPDDVNAEFFIYFVHSQNGTPNLYSVSLMYKEVLQITLNAIFHSMNILNNTTKVFICPMRCIPFISTAELTLSKTMH